MKKIWEWLLVVRTHMLTAMKRLLEIYWPGQNSLAEKICNYYCFCLLNSCSLYITRLEAYYKKIVLRNFAKFTGKHLCQRLFFNKVAGPRAATCFWTGVFLWILRNFWEIPFFTELPWWLLLYIYIYWFPGSHSISFFVVEKENSLLYFSWLYFLTIKHFNLQCILYRYIVNHCIILNCNWVLKKRDFLVSF